MDSVGRQSAFGRHHRRRSSGSSQEEEETFATGQSFEFALSKFAEIRAIRARGARREARTAALAGAAVSGGFSSLADTGGIGSLDAISNDNRAGLELLKRHHEDENGRLRRQGEHLREKLRGACFCILCVYRSFFG